MRVAITGASGFMGGVLARRLAIGGHTVFSFGRRRAAEIQCLPPNYAQWDISTSLIDKPQVDAVVHCAAKVGDWGPEEDYVGVNVEGTRRVIETFRNVDKFVHVSSASVYSGDQNGQNLSEDASTGVDLHTAYARSKAAAEKAAIACGREVIVLRPHIVYGPGDTTLLPRVLAARRLGWLVVPGNGRSPVSVTHIYNFVHAVERVLESRLSSGIFNIADSEVPPVGELLRVLLSKNGTPTRLIFLPRPIAWTAATLGETLWRLAGSRRAPRLTRYLVASLADGQTLDLTRAFELLGYEPAHTFRDDSVAARTR